MQNRMGYAIWGHGENWERAIQNKNHYNGLIINPKAKQVTI